jgi:hypothetical protein
MLTIKCRPALRRILLSLQAGHYLGKILIWRVCLSYSYRDQMDPNQFFSIATPTKLGARTLLIVG